MAEIDLSQKQERLAQIDLIKCIAIIAVIVSHAISPEAVRATIADFHIIQAVPVFMIVFGFNYAVSLRRRDCDKENVYYSKQYFKKAFDRLLAPLIIFLIIEVIMGILIKIYTGNSAFELSYLTFLGKPLLSLRYGDYFVTLLIESVLLFPFVYWCYRESPIGTLAGCFATGLAFELYAPLSPLFKGGTYQDHYLYGSSVFRFLPAIALGMWISDAPELTAKRNRFIWYGLIVSLAYILAYFFADFRITLFLNSPFWSGANVVSFFYPAVLVMLGIAYLPHDNENRIVKAFSQVGRASLYIFLVQMLYFGFFPTQYTLPLMASLGEKWHSGLLAIIAVQGINLFVCISLGLLFYLFSGWIVRRFGLANEQINSAI